MFNDLSPVGGEPLPDRADEINRRALLFKGLAADIESNYPASVVSNVGEAGFSEELKEGARVRRTHLRLERNRMIREIYFNQNPSPKCDLCGIDTTQSYPWTMRLLEIHHLLPLCSGARTSSDGTVLEDLVANCPTCHRAVHRFYEKWLGEKSRLDFENASEARHVYSEAKRQHLNAARSHEQRS